MTNNIANLSIPVLLWLATYLVHSTLLLGAAWLATRFIGRRSFALQDQIWKLAMVLPILTASIQQAVGPSSIALTQWTLAWPDKQTVAATDPPAGVARPDQRDGRGSHEESTVFGAFARTTDCLAHVRRRHLDNCRCPGCAPHSKAPDSRNRLDNRHPARTHGRPEARIVCVRSAGC